MTQTLLPTACLALLLTLISAIDLRTMRIPDPLNLLLLAAGLVNAWFADASLAQALIGAVVGYASIFIINLAYRALRNRDGVGLGDAKLLAGAGAWVGWMGLPFVVLIGSALGIVFVAIARIAGRQFSAQHALPFGPFLCAGIFVVWLVQTFA